MRIAIVGVGGLGGALADGLLRAGHAVTLCDRHDEKLAPYRARASIEPDPGRAVAGADVALLAVKPKATLPLAASLAPLLAAETLLVSCAAGIAVAALPGAAARAMPSIGASKGASATAVFLGPRCDPARDRPRLLEVFGAVGTVREVPDEDWLHAVTAVAASGPAFLLYAVEALVEGGREAGLPAEDALAFARGALVAAAARLEEGVQPASLRVQVTSPNGTTAAGVAVLHRAAVRDALRECVAAAVARSRALARGG